MANVINSLAHNLSGFIQCQIAAIGLNPDNLEAPAVSQAEGKAAGARQGKRKRKEKAAASQTEGEAAGAQKGKRKRKVKVSPVIEDVGRHQVPSWPSELPAS